jgi:hypothetical protein
MEHQYTNDKLMVHHRQKHFILSLHKNTTLSQLCHKLQKRTAVKMNQEQKQNNDDDSAYINLTLYCTDSSLHCKGEEVWRMGGHRLL